MKEIEALVNPHILKMEPYKSARDDFKGTADVYIDANESWYEGLSKCNRYPDPACTEVRRLLDSVLGLPFPNTVIGNGSDEMIDLLIRIFGTGGRDSIMIESPTYGAYKVFAATNNIAAIDVPLLPDLSLDIDEMKRMIDDKKPKLVFICSPNNPTGKVYPIDQIAEIAEYNKGITVVDEAYADFSASFRSAVPLIKNNPRLCVLRTLSKAWGIAGARVGILIADEYIKDIVMKVKPPYNVSVLAQRAAAEALRNKDKIRAIRDGVIENRHALSEKLRALPYTLEVIEGEGNFILLRVGDADRLYKYLADNGIIVRNRTHERYLNGCLRITIGSDDENMKLMEALDGYSV